MSIALRQNSNRDIATVTMDAADWEGERELQLGVYLIYDKLQEDAAAALR